MRRLKHCMVIFMMELNGKKFYHDAMETGKVTLVS